MRSLIDDFKANWYLWLFLIACIISIPTGIFMALWTSDVWWLWLATPIFIFLS